MIQQKTAAFHKAGPALKPNLEIRHPGLQRPSQLRLEVQGPTALVDSQSLDFKISDLVNPVQGAIPQVAQRLNVGLELTKVEFAQVKLEGPLSAPG